MRGLVGDANIVVLAAAGANLLKLLRRIAAALIFWLGPAVWGAIHRLLAVQNGNKSSHPMVQWA